MLKLGSLQHEQVDIPLVCEFALQLLEQSSKDLRLVTQLLRALLQTADATDLTLALQLLQLWLQHYAAPSASASGHRQQRLLQQNLQRLQTACWRLKPLPVQQRQQLRLHARQLETHCLADDNNTCHRQSAATSGHTAVTRAGSRQPSQQQHSPSRHSIDPCPRGDDTPTNAGGASFAPGHQP